jgi:hypothetical protein
VVTDRAEVVAVTYLTKHPECRLLEVENETCRELPGLLTPSRKTVQAILESYAEKDDSLWRLRQEDRPDKRREDLRTITAIVESTGARLKYKTRREGRWLVWEDGGQLVLAFSILASALVAPVIADNPFPAEHSALVVPGGRGLIDYKISRIASPAGFKGYRLVVSCLAICGGYKMLTRGIRGTVVERSHRTPQGQMMMF